MLKLQIERNLIKKFQEDGFVVIKEALSAKTLNTLQSECSKLTDYYIEKYQNIVTKHGPLRDDHSFKLLDYFEKNANFCPRANRKNIDLNIIRELFYNKQFYNLAQLLLNTDEELTLFQEYSIRSVVPQSFNKNITGWHQDASDKNPDLKMVIFWAPILNPDAGGLKLIPGSHKLGAVEHSDAPPFYHIKNAILDKQLNKEVSLHLELGDCVMFHHHMFHTARDNLSNKIRWSIDFRFQTNTQYQEKRVGLLL